MSRLDDMPKAVRGSDLAFAAYFVARQQALRREWLDKARDHRAAGRGELVALTVGFARGAHRDMLRELRGLRELRAMGST